MKLTKEQANKVWDLLVRDCGAHEPNRGSFVEYLTEDNSGHEYRFRGIFGHGGKLRLRPYHGLTADYYRESETPEKDIKMRALNTKLQMLWTEFQASA